MGPRQGCAKFLFIEVPVLWAAHHNCEIKLPTGGEDKDKGEKKKTENWPSALSMLVLKRNTLKFSSSSFYGQDHG